MGFLSEVSDVGVFTGWDRRIAVIKLFYVITYITPNKKIGVCEKIATEM